MVLPVSQFENPAAPACVPVYDNGTQDRIYPKDADIASTSHSVNAENAIGACVADLRSPFDCYHSEAYLIGCLVRLYGWRITQPGWMRRGWRAESQALQQEVA